MSNTINADDGIISGIAGLKYSADTSGALVLQTNGTTAITISASQVVTFAGAVSLGALTTSGNLTFTGSGNRIIGDMSGTFVNRLAFQTSTTNGATTPFLLPNGTGNTSGIVVANASDPTNCSFGQLRINATTDVQLVSSLLGTGTYLPLTMYTGGTERMRIDTSGNVGIGNTAPAQKLQIGTTGSDSIIRFGATSNGYDIGRENSSGNFVQNATQASPYNVFVWQQSGSEKMRLDSAGNLEVAGTGYAVLGYEKINVFGSAGFKSAQTNVLGLWNTAGAGLLTFYTGGGVNAGTVSSTGSDLIVTAGSSLNLTASGANIMTFNTNSTERIRITSAGGVSFGATGTAYGTSGQVLLSAGNAPPTWGVVSPAAGGSGVTSTTYIARYLIVAGGGGGKGGAGGGGGGGGMIESQGVFTIGTAYTITVGAGGAVATRGGSSSIAGTGFTTVTATGGGRGGDNDSNAADLSGGSGGGGGRTSTVITIGGVGTSGQGCPGGIGYPGFSAYPSGGGGGAGGNGGDFCTTISGKGGPGRVSSISGSAVTYAGGGGGSANSPEGGNQAGLGGIGGGGNGGQDGGAGGAGTANTGGGGGGAQGGTAGVGGSGIVIIAYPGAQRGSGGTVTSVGGNTIHTFTSTGTFTA